MGNIPSSIAVSPSGATLLAAQQVTTSAGVVLNEVVTLGDASSGNVGSVLASGAQLVEPGGANSQPVTGTFFPATQTVAAISMPNPMTVTMAALPSVTIGAFTPNPLTVTGTVTLSSQSVTQGTTPWTVAGNSASGSANAGNPVKIGGAFLTTQPTVTSGQTVDFQSTARGSQIVATGVDGFTVTLNANPTVTIASGTLTSLVTGPAIQTVTGTVGLTGNLTSLVTGPAIQTVTGTVGVTVPNPITVTGNVGFTNTSLTVTQSPTTSGGWSSNIQQSLQTSALVKASAGQIGGYQIYNPNTSAAYVFWYNAASTAAVGTVGQTSLLISQIGLAASAAANVEWNNGIPGANGIVVGVSSSPTTTLTVSIGLIITSLYK